MDTQNAQKAQDVLILEADFSVGVLGRGEEFTLFPLNEPLDEAARTSAKAQGFRWCGVLGIKDGVPRAECDPHPESIYTMCFAGMSFVRLALDRMKPPHTPQKGDAAEWLRALHSLQDPRA